MEGATKLVVWIIRRYWHNALGSHVIRAEVNQSALAFRCDQRLTHYLLPGALACWRPDLTPLGMPAGGAVSPA
jgi:hypothetical protein